MDSDYSFGIYKLFLHRLVNIWLKCQDDPNDIAKKNEWCWSISVPNIIGGLVAHAYELKLQDAY